ncbi:hypothetical protein FRB91_010734 [Serendipita sp. 411]|nr:hypothetical protein FRB91_010734 [Serendipita sp. 411]
MGTHLLNPTSPLGNEFFAAHNISQLPSEQGEDIGLYSHVRCSTQFTTPGISSASMSRIEINVPLVPAELKTVGPWVSRAQELKDKEPIIAYYCLYHATQTGISAKTKEKDTKTFLMSLMTTLETMKDKLNDHREISSDELAAKYIERFALKVFTNADNEDRKGESTRSTAKKFLAASNFFELLSIFDSKHLHPETKPADKIRYAKWKASDIAKAYREGRVPISGPATTMDLSEDELADKITSSHSEAEDMSLGSSAGVGPHASMKAPESSTSPLSHPVVDKSVADAQAGIPKPPLPSMHSSSSTTTVSPSKPSVVSPVPKYISTVAHTSPYVVDLSSPTSSVDPTTPLKTPGLSDGLWSTAATPGIESPNMFSPFPGGSFGKAAASLMTPATIAKFNALTGSNKVSPISPKARSGLSAMFVPPRAGESAAQEKHSAEEDTDEEDGQWSTAGNDPFSRQNSMMPASGPSVVVTSNLGVVHEEAPQGTALNAPTKPQASHQMTTPSILAVPLPDSASNTAPSSPHSRPDSLVYAASRPLPPVLPPATHTPTSIKSETHALPTDDGKSYKYTSNVIGDSASDGEVSYNVRRRANSVTGSSQPGPSAPPAGDYSSPQHARSSSVNTSAIPQPPHSAPPLTNTRGSSPADDEWERVSLSRLARLPQSGDEIGTLSDRLRDLGDPGSSSSVTPTSNDHHDGGQTPVTDFKSRRNTIKANIKSDPSHSGFNFGFNLPGVPTTLPVDDKKNNGRPSDSDSDSGGDIFARLPSAPAIPPTVQDQLPHVSIIKPASPRDELRVNPHFPIQPTNHLPSAPPLDSPSTPRDQGHARTSSTASTNHGVVPTHLPHGTFVSPDSSISPASINSIHRGYTPPNSGVSPHMRFTNGTIPFGAPVYVSPPVGQYAPTGPATAPPAHYATPMNGAGANYDEFGLGIPPRAPPTELDPETLGKVQKHTKFALSALNFDDLETAREELKKALRMLS